MTTTDSLSLYRKKVTSQDGEDGIIEEIFRRLSISNGWCIEFGAWDGKHLSNTWSLWHEHGWSAVLIEADPAKSQELSDSTSSFVNVESLNRMVSSEGADSLDQILRSTNTPQDFDLLSIDVDGTDYHIWKGLVEYRPKLVVIEHNPTIPPHIEFADTPEDHHIGSSALSLTNLAHEKNYSLVACTRTNLFFVASELLPQLQIEEPALESIFRTDHLTYIIASYRGRTFITKKPPYIASSNASESRLKP